jgi:hypothetical protein
MGDGIAFEILDYQDQEMMSECECVYAYVLEIERWEDRLNCHTVED